MGLNENMNLFVDTIDLPVRLEDVMGDTSDGEILISLPKGSGKYKINILPLENEE